MPDPVPEPFSIEVPQAELDDLRRRVRSTRWADDHHNDDWRYGVPGAYARELAEYWAEEFDWRATERAINAYDNFRVELDGVPIHFLSVTGKGDRRLPLLLTHGWPWTFWDFDGVIRPLTDPAACGLDDALTFDLIIPSLPGFGFSSPLHTTGIAPEVVADLWRRLMVDVLGHDRFGAHGGDWGAFVSANLAHAHADVLVGAHLSLPALLGVDFASNTAGRPVVGPDDYAPDEAGWYQSWTTRAVTARAHSVVHRASPQTLGWAFTDSPIGLASWIIERRRAWSDCDGNVESVFSKDFLLNLVSIYWFTRTASSSMRAYADMNLDGWHPRHGRTPVLEAPTALAVFPKDLLLLPRTLVERHAQLTHYTVMPRGGHFAAAEQPELLAADIHSFFRQELGIR